MMGSALLIGHTVSDLARNAISASVMIGVGLLVAAQRRVSSNGWYRQHLTIIHLCFFVAIGDYGVWLPKVLKRCNGLTLCLSSANFCE